MKMNRNTNYVIHWIGLMTSKYEVGSIYEKNKYIPLDWGQALARECYGENWNDIVPNDPTDEDVFVAKEWYDGKFPEGFPKWVDIERTFMIVREEKSQ